MSAIESARQLVIPAQITEEAEHEKLLEGYRDEIRDAIRMASGYAYRPKRAKTLPRSGVHPMPHQADPLSAMQPSTNDADRHTPLPDSEKSSAESEKRMPARMGGGGDGGNEGGGDGGNDDGPKKSDLSELETVDVSEALEKVSLKLGIEIPTLESGRRLQDGFRAQFWAPDDWEHVRAVQRMSQLSELEDYEEYYRFLAHAGAYRGGRITLENFAALLGYPDFNDLDSLFHRFMRTREKKNGAVNVKHVPMVDPQGQFVSANIMELGPANGDLIRRLARYGRATRPFKTMGRQLDEAAKRQYSRKYIWEMLGRGRQMLQEEIDEGAIDRSLGALDFIGHFARKLKQSKINGIQANLEAPDEEFLKNLEESDVEPHSQDVIAASLLMDRIDIIKLVRKIHILSRKEGTTRLFLAAPFPFERVSDADTHLKNVACIPNWKDPKDLRERWTADVPEIDADFSSLPDDESIRAQTIYNAILDLKKLGIDVYAIGEQPYEVYSTHCIVETAETIRREYPELRERKFMNPDLRGLIEAIFTEDPERRIPDEQLVGIPQEYRMVLFAAHVLPDNI